MRSAPRARGLAPHDELGGPVTGTVGSTAVVIRCHDQGRFLAEAVASVNEQSLRPERIVVVDDGSTDETAAVLASLSDNPVPITVVSRHPARGAVVSLNDGIAAAGVHEALLVLDADDRLSARFIELTAAALALHPECDLAYGAVRAFGAETWTVQALPFRLDHLLVGNYVPITALVRRTVFDRLGPFDERFNIIGFEDWEYWVRAAAVGIQGIAVEGCWLEYRRTGASRNALTFRHRLRARRQLWRIHRRHLAASHIVRWMAFEALELFGRRR